MMKSFRTKRVKAVSAGLSILFLISAGLLGVSSLSYAGVAMSNHDLTINGSGNFSGNFDGDVFPPLDNDEPCVFCHTPHKSVGAQTPLWNRNLTFVGFDVYSNSTMDSVPSNPPSTITLLCLSCHDGVGAMNSVSNSPGPGVHDMIDPGPGVFNQIGDTGTFGNMVNIGEGDPNAPGNVNLTNDHPVSINWADRGPGFYASPTNPALRLYNGQTIECTTCHDPHNGTPFEVGGLQFLVMSNANSDMCLSCHIK